MPKRKRDRHSDSDYDHLAKKIRKLERKMKRARHRGKSDSSSESDMQSLHNSSESKSVANVDDDIYEGNGVYSPGRSSWYEFSESVNDTSHNPDLHVVVADIHPPPTDSGRPPLRSSVSAVPRAEAPARPLLTTASEGINATKIRSLDAPPVQQLLQENVLPVPNTSDPQDQSNQIEQVVELDSDLMEILGEDPTCTKEYGPDIQKDLAVRLNHIATCGLSKENRKDIKSKYLTPANCKLIKAPSLNPEIRASLVESQAKRDKGIENKQCMNACALSSLSMAITMLLASDNKNPEVLKLLMDTARILGDIQHSDSILRRIFILSTVKKDLKDQLEKTKIDEMLFGSSLAETLKSAKTISKSGADIRSASAVKPTKQPAPKTSGRPLNYRGPPASRTPAAAGATKGTRPLPPPTPTQRPTTTRPTQHSGYKTSSRQQPARHRR